MSLEARLKKEIQATGPLTVADYMAQALYDPVDGYYATKVPIGSNADYITAPEMTQVFGEIIALWMINTWQKAGAPNPFHLVEMGPGRGTMMADIVRTLQKLNIPLPSIHLVEVSPLLKTIQQEKLKGLPITWHKDIATLPQQEGYCLMIANEFWDALPIQQHVKVDKNWVERKIELDGDSLVFSPRGEAIKETCLNMPSLVTQISQHLKANGGAALFIDYGYDHTNAIGDTLQSLQNHRKQTPLMNPGSADLTHHVDFHRLSSLFQENGLTAQGPFPQGQFLTEHGINERTEQLCQKATPEQKGSLRTAAVRLTHPAHMGNLFKVLSVST